MKAALHGESRNLFKNSVSQIGGRLFLSLGRMVVAMIIARQSGTERFGEYGLILSFLVFFEWLVDFGQTDIGVRDICQQPDREGVILKALAWLKAFQGIGYFLLLPVLLYVMRYPPDIIRAGAIGGIGLLFYAGVQIYRTLFKVEMCMERDIAAEIGGLVAALPLTWLACWMHAGIATLVACYMASRVVFFGLIVLFGRNEIQAMKGRVLRADIWALFRQAVPLGIAGLMVSLYDQLAVVMLSKLTDLQSEAQYIAATRFVYPVIIIVQALNSAFYPPLSALWKASPARFKQLQQTVLDASLLVGGGLFCMINSGAGFLMGLMGDKIGEAANVLQLLSWVVLARSVTTAMSPLIIVAGRQGKALWLTAASVVLQAIAFVVFVPRFGIIGAAIGYLLIEVVVGVVPVTWIGQQVSNVAMSWVAPAKILACAAAAVIVCGLLPGAGTIWSGMLSPLIYLALALAVGAMSPRQLQSLLAEITRKGQRAAAAPVALQQSET